MAQSDLNWIVNYRHELAGKKEFPVTIEEPVACGCDISKPLISSPPSPFDSRDDGSDTSDNARDPGRTHPPSALKESPCLD